MPNIAAGFDVYVPEFRNATICPENPDGTFPACLDHRFGPRMSLWSWHKASELGKRAEVRASFDPRDHNKVSVTPRGDDKGVTINFLAHHHEETHGCTEVLLRLTPDMAQSLINKLNFVLMDQGV